MQSVSNDPPDISEKESNVLPIQWASPSEKLDTPVFTMSDSSVDMVYPNTERCVLSESGPVLHLEYLSPSPEMYDLVDSSSVLQNIAPTDLSSDVPLSNDKGGSDFNELNPLFSFKGGSDDHSRLPADVANSAVTSMEMMHRRLGHVPYDRILRLYKQSTFIGPRLTGSQMGSV